MQVDSEQGSQSPDQLSSCRDLMDESVICLFDGSNSEEVSHRKGPEPDLDPGTWGTLLCALTRKFHCDLFLSKLVSCKEPN